MMEGGREDGKEAVQRGRVKSVDIFIFRRDHNYVNTKAKTKYSFRR